MRQGWSWVDGRNHKDQPSITPHFQKVFLPHPVVNWTVDKPGCLPAQQEGRVLPQSQTAKKNLQLSPAPCPANGMNWALLLFHTLEMCPAARRSQIFTQAQHQRNPTDSNRIRAAGCTERVREVQSCKAPGQVLLQGHLASTFVAFGTSSEN